MTACKYGYKIAVRVLLEAKGDPNITDEVKLHYIVIVYTITQCIMLQKGIAYGVELKVWLHF